MPDSNVCLPDCGENIENFWDKVDWREDAKWTVYVHTSPSGKYYVGITSQKNLNQRWRNGEGYVKNDHFYRAIQRYTWDAFTHEIIAEHLTKDEACKMEIKLIAELKSNDYHYGYNISSGGEGATGLFGEKNPNYGHHWSEEKRKAFSKYQKEHPYQLTEEQRQKMSERSKQMWQNAEYRQKMTGENHCCYGRTGEKHPMFGVRGADHFASKQVICLNTSEVFVSATEASIIKNANHSKLCMCCRGERKSCGKDENGNKLRWQYYTDYLKENNMTDQEARDSLLFIE